MIAEATGTGRAELRAAGAAVRRAQQALTNSQDAAERASAAVGQARERLAHFKNLDKEADEFRTAVIRNGGRSAALPGDLRKRQHQRGEAQAELEAALRISETLARERDQCLSVLERQREMLRDAVAGVVLETAVKAAHELQALNRRRHGLKLLLTELGVLGASPLQAGAGDIAAALADDDPPLPLDRSPAIRAGAFWRAQVDRLIADPEAEVGALPDARDLWGYNI
jgi:hypothetical protein